MPRPTFSTKNIPLTVDLLYVVVTAAGDEVVIEAPVQALTQRSDGLTADKAPLSQKKAPLTS